MKSGSALLVLILAGASLTQLSARKAPELQAPAPPPPPAAPAVQPQSVTPAASAIESDAQAYPTQCPAEGQRISVAIYPIKPAGADASLAQAMTALLSSQLTPSPKLKVIEEAMLKAVMERQAMNISDACDDTSCQVEVGKLVQAQKMIAGDLVKFGNKFVLSLKLIDIQTGTTEFSTEDKCSCTEDQLDQLVGVSAAKVRNHFCDQVSIPGLVTAQAPAAPFAPTPQLLAPVAPAQMATLYVFFNPAAHVLPPGSINTLGVVLLDGQRIGALTKQAPCLRKPIAPGAHTLTNQNSRKNISFNCAFQETCYLLVEISGWTPPFRYSSVSPAEAQAWIQGCQQVP